MLNAQVPVEAPVSNSEDIERYVRRTCAAVDESIERIEEMQRDQRASEETPLLLR